MSRRATREGVAWPRRGHTAEGLADGLLGRLWALTFAPGAFDADEVSGVRVDDHLRAVEGLRDRSVLP